MPDISSIQKQTSNGYSNGSRPRYPISRGPRRWRDRTLRLVYRLQHRMVLLLSPLVWECNAGSPGDRFLMEPINSVRSTLCFPNEIPKIGFESRRGGPPLPSPSSLFFTRMRTYGGDRSLAESDKMSVNSAINFLRRRKTMVYRFLMRTSKGFEITYNKGEKL